MRKRRCFADTELDAVTLEHERAQHALLAGQNASVPPPAQRTVLLPLPAVAPPRCRLPPSELACSEAAAMRLIGLVRSWRTLRPAAGVSGVDIQTPASPSPRCWPAAVGLTSKHSGVDVGGTSSDVRTGLHSTLGGSPILAREIPRSAATVVDRCCYDCASTWADRNGGAAGRSRTQQHRDSDAERRHLDSKSLRRPAFDFSVESLLAK